MNAERHALSPAPVLQSSSAFAALDPGTLPSSLPPAPPCVACGQSLPPDAPARCPFCHTRFSGDDLPSSQIPADFTFTPCCRSCGYDVSNLPDGACPECATPFRLAALRRSAWHEVQTRKQRLHPLAALLLYLLSMAGLPAGLALTQFSVSPPLAVAAWSGILALILLARARLPAFGGPLLTFGVLLLTPLIPSAFVGGDQYATPACRLLWLGSYLFVLSSAAAVAWRRADRIPLLLTLLVALPFLLRAGYLAFGMWHALSNGVGFLSANTWDGRRGVPLTVTAARSITWQAAAVGLIALLCAGLLALAFRRRRKLSP